MEIRERFLKYTIPEPNTGCLLWTGGANRYGRGYFQMTSRESYIAPRAAWTIERGPIPDGLCVLHRCDQPACVRIDHLFLGTQADNIADAARKGRLAEALRRLTHCRAGHEYTPETMRMRRGRRECLTCRRNWKLAAYARERAARAERKESSHVE